jgi:adenine/guanine phosphoribosyltransferase-like PRPP-binding protein
MSGNWAKVIAGTAIGISAGVAISRAFDTLAPSREQKVTVNVNEQTDSAYAAYARQDRNTINSLGV